MVNAMVPWTSRLSQLLDDSLFFEPPRDGGKDWFAPPANLVETDDDFQVSLELPGVRLEDVNVELKDGLLRIEGERKSELDENKHKVHRIERRYGKFLRSFSRPRDVDTDNIDAHYTDGLLTVSVPKAEKRRARKIEIRN